MDASAGMVFPCKCNKGFGPTVTYVHDADCSRHVPADPITQLRALAELPEIKAIEVNLGSGIPQYYDMEFVLRRIATELERTKGNKI